MAALAKLCAEMSNVGWTPLVVSEGVPCSPVAGLLGPVRAAPKAGCDVLQVDGCAADVFLFAAKDSAPKDAAELESYCK